MVMAVAALPVWLFASVITSVTLHVNALVLPVVSMVPPGPATIDGEVALLVLATAPGHCTVQKYVHAGALQLLPLELSAMVAFAPIVTLVLAGAVMTGCGAGGGVGPSLGLCKGRWGKVGVGR